VVKCPAGPSNSRLCGGNVKSNGLGLPGGLIAVGFDSYISKPKKTKTTYSQILQPYTGTQVSKTILLCSLVLVDVNIIAIYELWKSSEFVYYEITQFCERKYRLAIYIHFAEDNFGPFERIFFVIVLFESLSKHYLECHFRACIFKSASFFITVFLSRYFQFYHISIKQQMLDWYSRSLFILQDDGITDSR
jgi:hypothetical protein